MITPELLAQHMGRQGPSASFMPGRLVLRPMQGACKHTPLSLVKLRHCVDAVLYEWFHHGG